MIDYLGKNVIVKITGNCSNHGLSGIRAGRFDDKVDWLVGCPVFVDSGSGKNIAVGYDCEVVEVCDD